MAAFNRPTKASYAIHEKITVDTTDHEDHTFCGVMFPIEVKKTLPVDHLILTSISLRGQLGPLTVWITKEVEEMDNNASTNESVNGDSLALDNTMQSNQWSSLRESSVSRAGPITTNQDGWECIFRQTVAPSQEKFVELVLPEPVKLSPNGRNKIRGLYVHSTRYGDEAIVYDNQKGRFTHDDDFLRIHPGSAHVSNTAFGKRTIWGWGSPWRDHREFVGRLSYGVVYKLWNPVVHRDFGSKFQKIVRVLFMCQRRYECQFSRLPDDVIFYIVNMCRWDWANDDGREMNAIAESRDAVINTQNQQSIRRQDDDENINSRSRSWWLRRISTSVRGVHVLAGYRRTNSNQIMIVHDDTDDDGDDDGNDDEDYEDYEDEEMYDSEDNNEVE